MQDHPISVNLRALNSVDGTYIYSACRKLLEGVGYYNVANVDTVNNFDNVDNANNGDNVNNMPINTDTIILIDSVVILQSKFDDLLNYRLYPCSTKTREVLGNPSPTPERFPETREISRGKS